jgi:hypothetical protein
MYIREYRRRRRAQETPEEREARLKYQRDYERAKRARRKAAAMETTEGKGAS